ncbi:MAG TPA: glycosyltransferase family 39 protein [Steroidobacteraceae bacterium]|nr:glycosyltransferase family 39 protein [Steroidobacteraceae bacterium]
MTATRPTSTHLQRWILVGSAVGCFVLAWLAASWRPLWYDELYTFHVAQEPSLLATLRALLAGADTNPPLDYLLRHLSMTLLGDSPAAFRLPSVLAFLAGLFAIYGYVRPRVPFAAAAAAFLAPIGTAAVFFSYEGRAYALLFCSGALALLAWQRAVAATTPRRLAVLALALCVGPFSHYFGVLAFVPPALGEAWRTVERRRIDAGIVAAFAVATLASLLLWPIAKLALGMQSAFWASSFSLADAYQYFTGFLQYSDSPVSIVLACGVVLVLGLLAVPRWRAVLRVPVPAHELVGAIALAYTPLLAYVLASVLTGALTPRYVIAFVPGVAILLGYLVAVVAAVLPRTAWLAAACIAALGLGGFVRTLDDLLDEQGFPTELREVIETTPLPVAFDTPHKFLEYSYYAPASVRERFVYPMNASLAALLRGFNNDEIALRGLARIEPLRVTDYREFTAQTHEFLLVRDLNFAPALARQLPGDGFCLLQIAQARSVVLLHVTWGCWD